jgi:hypothetical protein
MGQQAEGQIKNMGWELTARPYESQYATHKLSRGGGIRTKPPN